MSGIAAFHSELKLVRSRHAEQLRMGRRKPSFGFTLLRSTKRSVVRSAHHSSSASAQRRRLCRISIQGVPLYTAQHPLKAGAATKSAQSWQKSAAQRQLRFIEWLASVS